MSQVPTLTLDLRSFRAAVQTACCRGTAGTLPGTGGFTRYITGTFWTKAIATENSTDPFTTQNHLQVVGGEFPAVLAPLPGEAAYLFSPAFAGLPSAVVLSTATGQQTWSPGRKGSFGAQAVVCQLCRRWATGTRALAGLWQISQ